MKLVEFKPNNFMLQASKEEAYSIIRSLSGQLCSNNSNSERIEYYPEGAEYFSISIHFDKESFPSFKRSTAINLKAKDQKQNKKKDRWKKQWKSI
jgi:hypothetical protein